MKQRIGIALYNPGAGELGLIFSLNKNLTDAHNPGLVTGGPILC